MIYKLLDRFKEFPEVDSIIIAGSRASGNNDSLSDYDIYVYGKEPVPEEKRAGLYNEYCSKTEVGNKYFEYEDNCILKDGTYVDIIFRDLEMLCKFIDMTVNGHKTRNGYTTCFWHNLLNSEIYFDRSGEFRKARERFSIPYPEELRKNIIKRNMNLLHDALPAYDKQLSKAVARNDLISINHRTTAFLESYFDVIFALNRMTHPGEKRLISICKKKCSILPDNFEENLNCLLTDMFAHPEKISEDIENIIRELKNVSDI